MNLEQFAKEAGVVLIACDDKWGGKIGFYETDSPNTRYCGYRSNTAAYMAWLDHKFGSFCGAAVLKLMRTSINGGGRSVGKTLKTDALKAAEPAELNVKK